MMSKCDCGYLAYVIAVRIGIENTLGFIFIFELGAHPPGFLELFLCGHLFVCECVCMCVCP